MKEVKYMINMPGICEKCKRLYRTNGISFEGVTSNGTITNNQIGTCPYDGGRIMNVDGVYNTFDDQMYIELFDDNKDIKKILSILDNVTVNTTVSDVESAFKVEYGVDNVFFEFFYKIFKITNNIQLTKRFMMWFLTSLIAYGTNEVFDNIKEKVSETPTEKLQQEFEEFKSRTDEQNQKIIEQNQMLIQQNKKIKSQQKQLLEYEKRKSQIVQKKKPKWKKSKNKRR